MFTSFLSLSVLLLPFLPYPLFRFLSFFISQILPSVLPLIFCSYLPWSLHTYIHLFGQSVRQSAIYCFILFWFNQFLILVLICWLSGTAFAWPRSLTQKRNKTTLAATASKTTSNVSGSSAYRSMGSKILTKLCALWFCHILLQPCGSLLESACSPH